MCGRYLRKSDKQKIAEAFRVRSDLSDLVLPEWDYNVAPTTWQPVIRLEPEGGARELVLMRWGLVPWFARSLKDFGFNTVNARAETLATNRMWQGPLERRRCLVPADGFYEWKVLPSVVETDLFGAAVKGKKVAVEKQPYAFTLRTGELFAFAGLWERWRDPENAASTLESFTIITTEPNELTAEVHTRMPAILQPRDYAAWLDAEAGERPPVELLRPYPAEWMQAAKAHKDVGNVRNNHAGLVEVSGDEARRLNSE